MFLPCVRRFCIKTGVVDHYEIFTSSTGTTLIAVSSNNESRLCQLPPVVISASAHSHSSPGKIIIGEVANIVVELPLAVGHYGKHV